MPADLRLPDARLLFDLFKLRIGLVIGVTALLGLAVTPGPLPAPWQVVALVLAETLAAAAAGAFNQMTERELDARMHRTRHRAFVTGRLQAGPGWLLAILLLGAAGVGLAAYAFNALTAVYTFLGAFTYAVVYTRWLKRRTAWNIVIGGLAGSFAVLAGGAAVAPGALAPLTLSFAVVLFLWTPPHFWSLAIACHEDYAMAGVPMLPVVVGDARAARIVQQGAGLLVLAALVPAACGMGPLYLVTALGAGFYLLVHCRRLVRAPGPAAAMANFHASLIYLAALMAGALLDVAWRA
jgi:protoheme IX farnesyltransferase